MDKIKLLWRVIFPICLAIIFLSVQFLPRGFGYGYGILLVLAVSIFCLYVLFLGIEELLREEE